MLAAARKPPIGAAPGKAAPVHYPDSDGLPMAENTVQYDWIVKLKENIDALIPDFVAGDLFWYPVEGDNRTRVAPDVMVAIGRPKGPRSSYLQWDEDGIAPQVVFEVQSPGNTLREMYRKLNFYDRYGVSEYYVYNPDDRALIVCLRVGDRLTEIPIESSFKSPLLGIEFRLGEDLEVYGPSGQPFLGAQELFQQVQAERQKAEAERQKAEAERQRAEALAAKLRALGIDPDA